MIQELILVFIAAALINNFEGAGQYALDKVKNHGGGNG